jgi:hypothetical protein
MTHENDPPLIERKDGSVGVAARGYSWEPFVPEHVRTLVHGANSPRVVEAVARIVESKVVEQAPWLVEPIFGDSLARYCRAEARARLLSEHILNLCETAGAHKVPQKLWDSASTADNTASKMATELGITPLARARLAAITTSADVGQASLDQLQARGAEIVARRRAELAAAEHDEQTSDERPI